MYHRALHVNVAAVFVLLVVSAIASGEVTRFEITKRAPFAGGKSFGDAGAYELISGKVHLQVYPRKETNRIVDINHVRPKKAAVEFSSDLFILTPKNPKKRVRFLYDVNNRGRKLALKFFNDAAAKNDPKSLSDAGNGFLMRHGFTVVWSGWDGELLPGEGRMQLHAPIAGPIQGKPITGQVRYEICLAESAPQVSVNRGGHGAYRPTPKGLKEATLTWRLRPLHQRVSIPRDQFKLSVTEVDKDRASQLPLVKIELAAGFQPGYLYELIYEARDPLVHGLCFPAVRDLMIALKNGTGRDNPLPLQPGQKRFAYGFGVSQSGRFLRAMLHERFHTNGKNELPFDGYMPHVAGGGLGSFNQRFAQPTLFATEHERRDCPSDRFPFAYHPMTNPTTGVNDQILPPKYTNVPTPKVMHTQSSTEYWARSGSLVHTDPAGRFDTPDLPDVRIYAFGGTQHGPSDFPPSKGIGQQLANPGDYRPHLRALLLALDAWCQHNVKPPPNRHPTIRERTLVEFHQQTTGFPAIPGVRYPTTIQVAALLDFGPRYRRHGIVDFPRPRRRNWYQPLVPKCGPDGNELGCLLPPEVKVPIATFTGWNLRSAVPGPRNAHVGLRGSYIPLPRTKAERLKTKDPRRSLEERYGSVDAYRKKLQAVCDAYVKQRLLLKEDVGTIVATHAKRYGK